MDKNHKTQNNGPRWNNAIRATNIRLIDNEGNNLGVVTLGEALKRAFNQQLDVVEVSATAVPPVCRIVNRGKYLYELSKSAVHQPDVRLKEIQVGPSTAKHDLEIKIRQAEGFLKANHPVKITVKLRGREKAHPEIAVEQVNLVINALRSFGRTSQEVKVNMGNIAVTLQPVSKAPPTVPSRAPYHNTTTTNTVSPVNTIQAIPQLQPA